jgi:hypothetical protein
MNRLATVGLAINLMERALDKPVSRLLTDECIQENSYFAAAVKHPSEVVDVLPFVRDRS